MRSLVFLWESTLPAHTSGQILMGLTRLPAGTHSPDPAIKSSASLWSVCMGSLSVTGVSLEFGKERDSSQGLPNWCELGMNVMVSSFLHHWVRAYLKWRRSRRHEGRHMRRSTEPYRFMGAPELKTWLFNYAGQFQKVRLSQVTLMQLSATYSRQNPDEKH